jgi:hypothetical protein
MVAVLQQLQLLQQHQPQQQLQHQPPQQQLQHLNLKNN